MPQDWEPGILLSELADEPELSEEFSAIFARLKGSEGGHAAGATGTRGSAGALGDAAPAQIIPPSPCDLVLNFQGVSYLNSSHIAALLRMRKLVAETGRRMILCAVNDEVRALLTVTGLDKVFTVEPDTMTALARIQMNS